MADSPPWRINRGTIIALTVATIINVGGQELASHKQISWRTASSIRTWFNQITILVLGQTHKAIRREQARETDAEDPEPNT